jgi:hypothetical protein
MTCIHTLAAGLLLLAPLAAQAPDKARMKEDLYALASPGLEGRGTGERGQRLAADLVARRFREAGLQPLRPEGFGGPTPFHWPYALERRTLDEGGSTLTLDGAPLRMGRDAFASRAAAGEGPALFVGYGVGAADLGYDAYAGADLKGKWAVAFDGEPPRPAGVDAAAWSRAAHSDAKAAAARKAGALGLVLLQDGRPGGRDLAKLGGILSRWARAGRVTLKGGGPGGAATILVSQRGLKAFPADLPARQEALDRSARPDAPHPLGRLAYAPKATAEDLPTANLIGVLPGSDPLLKDEFVILSAHHDHVGVQDGKVHPGADDNASGTTVLLEVARLLRGAKPRRSLLFLSVSGEEIGLFGSEAFVKAPPVALSRVKADLNIDMVGRNGTHELSVTPARVDGAVTTLTAQARALAAAQGLRLTDEADQYWQRSDHYTFFKAGIPSIFFFGGMHRDYHKPSDTPDKIDLDKLVRVAAFVKALAMTVADDGAAPSLLAKEAWSAWSWPSVPAPPLAAGAAK